MEIEIAPALAVDAADIAKVHVESWRVAYRGIVPDAVLDGLSAEDRTATWEERLKPGNRLTYVAKSSGRLVGWAAGGPTRDKDIYDVAELYGIYLAPAVWNRGVGRRLLRAVEMAVKETGCTAIYLWVLVDNARARTFYERNGFSVEGTCKDFVMETVSLKEIRYMKRL